MKKILLILPTLLLLFCISCKNSEEPKPDPEPEPEPVPPTGLYTVTINNQGGGTVLISNRGNLLNSGDTVKKGEYVVCQIYPDADHIFAGVNVYKGISARDSFIISSNTTITPVFNTITKDAVAKESFKVCNYNIRLLTGADSGDKYWNNRKSYLFAMINKHAMDVCGIEELTAGQRNDFNSTLTDYEIIGYGRDSGKEYGVDINSGEGTGLIYRKSSFIKMDQGRFFLSNTPKKPSKVSGASFNRMVTWVKLKERSSEKEFYFFATHFDHPTTATGIATRSAEADIALKIVPTISGTSPMFFAGDFNCRPEEAAYTKLAAVWDDSYITMGASAQGGYVCNAEQLAKKELAADCACKGNTYTGTYNTANDPLPKRIDFVLYNDSYAYPTSYLADCDSLGHTTLPSDHLPIITTMVLK